MATRNAVVVDTAKTILATWSGLLNSDVGDKAEVAALAISSVQITGTWGAGGAAAVEGSNDGTNWFTLKDAARDPIVMIADGIRTLHGFCRYVRPHVTAGDGTTTLVAVLFGERG